jgi:hypothetical protein
MGLLTVQRHGVASTTLLGPVQVIGLLVGAEARLGWEGTLSAVLCSNGGTLASKVSGGGARETLDGETVDASEGGRREEERRDECEQHSDGWRG